MMDFEVQIIPYTLALKKPATTSRGTYQDRPVWYVVVRSRTDRGRLGIGECAPLFDLSSDYDECYRQRLQGFAEQFEHAGCLDDRELLAALKYNPSMLFGFETAWQQYQTQSFTLWQTPFTQGQSSIPINGLIWMASFEDMLHQINDKLELGYRCIKLKIGAINFEEELSLLRHIRKHFSVQDVTLRVDANGAFTPDEALDKLKRLSELDLHSIEQPIRAGQWEQMAKLVQETPLPIALDEELIGVYHYDEKYRLLNEIKPQFIILKPTLHGGLSGAEEWIHLAKQRAIGWWVTSAMESNIGLNAIAQWCSCFSPEMPQGLGTGQLYTNNIMFPLEIRQGQLWLDFTGGGICVQDVVSFLRHPV